MIDRRNSMLPWRLVIAVSVERVSSGIRTRENRSHSATVDASTLDTIKENCISRIPIVTRLLSEYNSLVRVEGFEPPAPWFVAKCSVH